MHEHDLDLIAAYADGTLEADRGEAARLVETCAECRAEYQAQRRARAWLQAAPAVALTPAERQRLHERVAASLDAEQPEQPAPVTTLPRGVTPWWQRLAPVAAGVLVVVGVAGLLRLGGEGGLGAAQEALQTTTAAAEESARVADAPSVGGDHANQTFEAQENDLADDGAAHDEAASELGDAATVEELLQRLAQRVAVGDAPPLGDLACSELVEEPTAVGRGSLQGRPVEVYLVGDAAADPPSGLVAAVPDCEVLGER